jgi:hypothetical protein
MSILREIWKMQREEEYIYRNDRFLSHFSIILSFIILSTPKETRRCKQQNISKKFLQMLQVSNFKKKFPSTFSLELHKS